MTTELPTPEKAFELYRHLVETSEQAIPILTYGTDSEIVPMGLMGVPGGALQEVLARSIDAAAQSLGRPKWLLSSNEGWQAKVSKEELENARPGDLARRVEAGEQMQDVVALVGVSAETSWQVIVPFVRDENGHVTWDKPMITEAVGGVADVLLQAVR